MFLVRLHARGRSGATGFGLTISKMIGFGTAAGAIVMRGLVRCVFFCVFVAFFLLLFLFPRMLIVCMEITRLKCQTERRATAD
jgi:hypothetical protein